MSLKILQWNCRSALNKWGEFIVLARDFDVICLNETFYKKNSYTDLKGFYCIREDDPEDVVGGGIAIYIRDYINFRRLKDLNIVNGFKWINVEIEWNEKKINVLNVYRSPSARINSQNWRKSLDFAEARQNNTLVCGDFNAHNLEWGSELKNDEGDWLLEAIINNNLEILNSGEATRINNRSKKKAVQTLQ